MKWFTSRLVRAARMPLPPSTCYVLFHAPWSLEHACDCSDVCKWPPRNGGGASDALCVPLTDETHPTRKRYHLFHSGATTRTGFLRDDDKIT